MVGNQRSPVNHASVVLIRPVFVGVEYGGYQLDQLQRAKQDGHATRRQAGLGPGRLSLLGQGVPGGGVACPPKVEGISIPPSQIFPLQIRPLSESDVVRE